MNPFITTHNKTKKVGEMTFDVVQKRVLGIIPIDTTFTNPRYIPKEPQRPALKGRNKDIDPDYIPKK